MYIAKLKDGPKGVKKILSMIWKRFQNGMMEGERMASHKNEFLFEETLGAFSFFFSFFQYFFFHFFSLFFYAPSLEGLGVLMIIEVKNHFFKNFFSDEMVWTVKCKYQWWTHIPGWSYARHYG
jgi:hypothetical protein